jgi:hypothetical protein
MEVLIPKARPAPVDALECEARANPADTRDGLNSLHVHDRDRDHDPDHDRDRDRDPDPDPDPDHCFRPRVT